MGRVFACFLPLRLTASRFRGGHGVCRVHGVPRPSGPESLLCLTLIFFDLASVMWCSIRGVPSTVPDTGSTHVFSGAAARTIRNVLLHNQSYVLYNDQVDDGTVAVCRCRAPLNPHTNQSVRRRLDSVSAIVTCMRNFAAQPV